MRAEWGTGRCKTYAMISRLIYAGKLVAFSGRRICPAKGHVVRYVAYRKA